MPINLMSMEDLFYGPPETTYIIPTPEEAPPRRYIEREIREREIIEPPRRLYQPEPPRPVARYIEPPSPPAADREIRPIERLARVHTVPEPVAIRAPHEEIRKVVEVPVPVVDREIRPIERLARIHTVPEPVPVRAPHEEIRKVVEVPVPVPVEVPVRVEAPPRIIERVVHVPAPAPPTPVVEVVKRSITPPIQRPVVYHPIELKVPMCCEKCAKKVKDRLLDLEGVENVVTDQYNQKVTVYGHVDPARVLNRVKLVKKRSAFWDMTVDYSKEYRRFREAQAEAARADAARVEAAKAKAHAKAVETHAKAMVASSSPVTVVVNLPQEHHGPKVTAILPGTKERAMPYAVSSRTHSHRYVSPPRAYRQEFYNGRHADSYF
ncbi:hypothetical protein M758_3G199100 [Ceratodon purpureus]|uniref:HMA domain-containing protein n=1 Tax=Ceratodon purpureus TaxID=3225 RepID=A0A8T0IM09_CERPU|nr:hypothetical protein KC19_3G200100 [Ceratodon purpureus]KAG0623754.1 hypothetical protein M758_3G199100 [Ceratodon purpureus]